MFFKNFEKLKPYQVEGADFALSNFYSGNRDKPGMGKSAQALLAICKFIEKNRNSRALIICPQYLRRNWMNEISTWTTLEGLFYSHKPRSVVWDKDIVVISYDQLKLFSWSWSFNERIALPLKKCRLTRTYEIGTVPYRSPKWGSVSDEKFGFVVVDEAHNLKNPKAKRSINGVNFIKHLRPKYLLLLSGTPIKKKIQDLFVPLYLMALGPKTAPKITDRYKSYFLFCHRFTNVVKTPFATVFKGSKNLEELKTYLVNRYIGRDPEKVLDLPEFTDVYVEIDYKEDPALLKEFEDFNSGVKSATSDVKALSAALKAPYTLEYVTDLLEQDIGSVVVFTDHREPVKIIVAGLRKAGFKVEAIMGGEKNRDESVAKLQAGELDGLVCTYGAGSEGLNMTASYHEVFNDPHWVPEVMSQARGRIRRITQRNRCVYHTIGGAVVDRKINQSLKTAIKVIEKVWN